MRAEKKESDAEADRRDMLDFSLIYTQNVGKVRRYCSLKLQGHPDYIEDCVQESFRVLLESKDRDIENISGFLMKTASNFVNLKFREIKKARCKHVSIEEKSVDIPCEQKFLNGVPDAMILLFKDRIIGMLSEEEVELLEKSSKGFEDTYKTVTQLAAEYGCSEATIRRRILILREKIKRLVKELLDELDI